MESPSKLLQEDRQPSEFDERLSESLDKLGYSQEMVQLRREKNQLMDEIQNQKSYPYRTITVGSKAEGTALYFESDIDRLFEVEGVVCVDGEPPQSNSTVFYLDRTGCSPGYTRLKLVRLSDKHSVLKEFLRSEHKDVYIYNDFTIVDKNHKMIDINGVRISEQDQRGPSFAYRNTTIKYDFVSGFKCQCRDLIQRWVERPRKYKWPDIGLIDRVSSSEGHVVPVANKGTIYPDTEWRICFTTAEQLLLHSLGERQTKFYILLKLFAKSVLKPLCSEITPYIMKNIVFWIVELTPEECFSQRSLTDMLTNALVYLRDSLNTNVLNSYMIAERNLLEGRVTAHERDTLLKELNAIINEKYKMLQRCDKIRLALDKVNNSFEDFSQEGEKRKIVEKLVLKKNILFKELDKPGSKIDDLLPRLQDSDLYRQYEEELLEIVVPDREEIAKLGENLEEVYRHRLSTILS